MNDFCRVATTFEESEFKDTPIRFPKASFMCKDRKVERIRQTTLLWIAIAVGDHANLVPTLQVPQGDHHIGIWLGACEPCVHIESIQPFGICSTRSTHIFKGSEKCGISYFFVLDDSFT